MSVIKYMQLATHGTFGASLRLPKEKKCETKVFR